MGTIRIQPGKKFSVKALDTVDEDEMVGAKIRVESAGASIEGVLLGWEHGGPDKTGLCFEKSGEVLLYVDKKDLFKVLEPAPDKIVHPVEPVNEGAVVRVDGGFSQGVFCLLDEAWTNADSRWTWASLVNDSVKPIEILFDGVSDEAVDPNRIDEWPEDETEIRKYQWKDRQGDIWAFRDGQWRFMLSSGDWSMSCSLTPLDFLPLTRVK